MCNDSVSKKKKKTTTVIKTNKPGLVYPVDVVVSSKCKKKTFSLPFIPALNTLIFSLDRKLRTKRRPLTTIAFLFVPQSPEDNYRQIFTG
jgi:hypothetical protein